MTKRFVTAFAEAGDRAEISNSPVGNDVNFQTGYPSKYEADPELDPDARFVERDKSNQLFNDITGNIKHWQEEIYPEFITSVANGGTAFPYKDGAIVNYLSVDYISLIATNTDTPPSAKWEVFRPVNNAGNESIGGVKTFSASPLVPTPTAGSQASNKSYSDNLDSANVKKTGDQSISGIKTFTSSPIVPTPATGTQAANKAYVDSVKDALFPVGRVILSMGTANPSTEGHPGTWSLLYTVGASVKFGDGTSLDGVASGDNNPSVPLLQHSHTASFSGNALPAHQHSKSYNNTESGTIHLQTAGGVSQGTISVDGTSAGTPSGSVSVGSTGEILPTLDVSGKGIAINFWKRIS